jgi:hypothetical protein
MASFRSGGYTHRPSLCDTMPSDPASPSASAFSAGTHTSKSVPVYIDQPPPFLLPFRPHLYVRKPVFQPFLQFRSPALTVFIFPSQEIMSAYYSMPSLSVKKVNADALDAPPVSYIAWWVV